MTKNTTTNNYRIPADQLQNLEIDRNGRVAPRLHDLEPLKNTLLSVLYPGIKVASVNVPAEPLDDYEEAQVENAMARLVWNGVHYKLVGASGSAKKGKFYFVDQEHSRAIAERFQHWPQAAIVYFGILVSPCKVMMEEPEARVLVVPDGKLGTNDCRGWIRRSVFQRLQQKHDDEILSAQVERLRRERYGKATDENRDQAAESVLLQDAKREIAGKRLAEGRFYQFRMAFADTQAKGAFKLMEDDVSDALEADFVLPESAVKPGLKIRAVMYSIFGPGRRFRGDTVVGIREVSRQLEFESSYTLVEHAPEDSIQLEILPQAMKQVAKLSEAVGEGRYEDLLEILGHHPDRSLPDGVEPDNEEFRVVEGLLLADASGEIVRHPYVNNQLNKLLARWAFKAATGGGFRLPAFALMDDGYLFLKDGQVVAGSDWIPEHKAIVPLASKHGLCVRYPIRMVDDLLPFGNLSDDEIVAQLNTDLCRRNCTLTDSEIRELVQRQLRVEGTYVLHSETAKKNGGDFDFDWICVVEQDRFPRFVKDRFSRGLGEQQGKNKANKAKDPWFNLEHVAMKARGNHIGSITDLMTSCRAVGQEELAAQLAKELQNALDSLKWQVQPDLKLVAEIRQQVRQSPWLRYKNERRVSDLPLHLEVEKTDRVGHLYNHVRKQIEDLLINKAPIEAFKALVVGEQVSREMLEDCRFVNRVYAAMVGKIAARREQLKEQLEKAKAEWDTVRQSSDKELRRQKLFAMNQAYGACRGDEERGRYEMKAVLAFIRIWAQNKAENRMGWLQALNRIVCNGQRSSGSILFLAFPQELILKLAERTGGKPVRVHVPRLYDGLVRTDSSGRTFLVDPLKGGGQKHTFLFKYRDGKILLDDDKAEQAKGKTSTESCIESETAEAAIPAAVVDEAVEFNPGAFSDEDASDAPWVM
ncbi:MAG TPA: hypothetical protein VH350_12710 [Candidatus Sulfotelmatobacter sp.]|jgi:hypothetical protein|nr:hypothetical protein [Candidatus Sulfotelmatobacter sp.]